MTAKELAEWEKRVASEEAFDRWAGHQSYASHQEHYKRLLAEVRRLRAKLKQVWE